LRNNTFKTKLSVPYRLLASRLVPTYGREHPEQPETVLPLIFRLSTTDKNVKRIWEMKNIIRNNAPKVPIVLH